MMEHTTFHGWVDSSKMCCRKGCSLFSLLMTVILTCLWDSSDLFLTACFIRHQSVNQGGDQELENLVTKLAILKDLLSSIEKKVNSVSRVHYSGVFVCLFLSLFRDPSARSFFFPSVLADASYLKIIWDVCSNQGNVGRMWHVGHNKSGFKSCVRRGYGWLGRKWPQCNQTMCLGLFCRHWIHLLGPHWMAKKETGDCFLVTVTVNPAGSDSNCLFSCLLSGSESSARHESVLALRPPSSLHASQQGNTRTSLWGKRNTVVMHTCCTYRTRHSQGN